MKKLRLRRPRLSLENLTGLAVLVIASSLLLGRLVALLPGMSTYERILPSVSDSLHALWTLPVNLPLVVARGFVAAIAPGSGIGVSRLPGVLLALITACMMYWLLQRWYGYRLALFGMLLFLTAPWFLRVGRLATSDIVFPLGMTTILVLAALWHNPKRGRLLLYATTAVAAVLLYIPGMIWLLLGVLLIERRNVLAQLSASKLHTFLNVLLGIILLLPMIHALTLRWQNVHFFVGLPTAWPSPLDFIEQFAHVWQYLFIGGWHNPVYNLGGLPIVDIVIGLFFIVGIYLHAQHPHATRTKTHLYLGLVGALLIALQTVSFSLILPIVVVMAVGGVGYLLHLWLKVFPRNPLARGFGIGLMAVVLCFTMAYNVRNYYVAWPHSPVTRAAFQRQP
jgi:hypothetical protein